MLSLFPFIATITHLWVCVNHQVLQIKSYHYYIIIIIIIIIINDLAISWSARVAKS